MTIPELGTIRATHPPAIVLTSNRTRDLHDAVKRRCLYHWIDYPDARARGRDRPPPRAGRVGVAGGRRSSTAVARMRDSDVQKPPGIAEAIDWLRALELLGVDRARRGDDRAARSARCSSTARTRTWSARAGLESAGREGRDRRARPGAARRRLRPPAARGRRAGHARALGALRARADADASRSPARACTGPRARCSSPTTPRCRRSTPCSSRSSARAWTFGHDAPRRDRAATSRRPDDRPGDARGARRGAPGGGLAGAGATAESSAEAVPVVPVAASDEERLRGKRFDALEPRRARAAVPADDAARARHAAAPHAPRTSATAAASTSTCAARCAAACAPAATRSASRAAGAASCARRLVLLCDITGSMEPYARAYLQFLTCAGSGRRGVRLRHPADAAHARARDRAARERAIQRAAAAAPDWSSGTRIGDALKAFNDRHGRRGMARGAVVVILSDGWERGDPALVGREMERLARLAHRIVWVNPRVGAAGFSPRAGGMVAALPHCDALVSGHSFEALARGRRGDRRARASRACRAPPEPTRRSRGRARRRCRAARWRCRAATARAAARRRPGWDR